MARLTDEDLERLLRETFADKEKLVADQDNLADTLPEATKRRRPVAPVLLAAAAVLVVLGGILYGVNRGGGADPAPPVATAPLAGAATDDADIWAAVILAMAQRFQPTSRVFVGASAVAVQTEAGAQGRAAATFSEADKARIEQLVGAVVPVRWSDPVDSACTPRVLVISLGGVSDVGDHKEVAATIGYNCSTKDSATYRVESSGDTWTVTGKIRTTTVGGPKCALVEAQASPPATC